VSPSLSAPQDRDALESAAGVSSPEIQEVVKGSGAAQLLGLEGGDAQIFDLARFLWTASFEADTPVDEDEESTAGRAARLMNSSSPRQR
jgi:hypothetical protein